MHHFLKYKTYGFFLKYVLGQTVDRLGYSFILQEIPLR